MSSKEKLSSTTNLVASGTSPSIPAVTCTSDELSEDSKSDHLRRTASSSSIVTLGMYVFMSIKHHFKSIFCLDSFQTISATNVQNQIWKGLTALEQDIYPDVAAVAQKLTKYIRQKVKTICTQSFVLCLVKFVFFFFN